MKMKMTKSFEEEKQFFLDKQEKSDLAENPRKEFRFNLTRAH